MILLDLRKYISNIIFPWQPTLNDNFELVEAANDVIKEQKVVIHQQSEYLNALQINIANVYEMFNQLAKAALDANLNVQLQIEKEKEQNRIERELRDEVHRLKVIN